MNWRGWTMPHPYIHSACDPEKEKAVKKIKTTLHPVFFAAHVSALTVSYFVRPVLLCTSTSLLKPLVILAVLLNPSIFPVSNCDSWTRVFLTPAPETTMNGGYGHFCAPTHKCDFVIITITVQDVLAWFRSEKTCEFQAFKYTVAPWPDHGCVLLYWWRVGVWWTDWTPGPW